MDLNYTSSDQKYGIKRVMFEDCDYNDIAIARMSEDAFKITTYCDDYSENGMEEYVSKENFIKSIARMVVELGVANEIHGAIEILEREES